MTGEPTEEPRSDAEERAVEKEGEAPSSTTTADAPEASEAPRADAAHAKAPASPAKASPLDLVLLPTWQHDVARIDPATRSQIVDDAAASQQRRTAAETLWAASQPAEALVLAREAYRSARLAHDRIPLEALAESRRIAAARKHEDAVLDEARSLDDRALPVLDAALRPADAHAYQTWLDAQAILFARCAYFSTSRERIRAVQGTRIATVTVLVLVALVTLWWRNRPLYEVTASGSWNGLPQFVPEHALDGDPTTEWLLPDTTRGWLEINMRPARTLSTVRVENGHNGSVGDRAVRDFRIELFHDGEHVQDLTGTFDAIDATAPARTFSLDHVPVDRIRFVVVSWHRQGAALADLTFE